VRLGLGYVKDVSSAEVRELVAERERHGRYRSPADLAARSGAGRATLQQLAWSGACDGLVEVAPGASADTRRRVALWQLGLAAHGQGVGEGATQLALALPDAAPPRLRPLGRWQRLIADYATSGVTAGDHALAILRDRLTVPLLATSAQLARLPAGCSVAVAGLVIARQRPGTAHGTMFLLFEDEHGTINLIVPPPIYERYRRLARAEPLLLARGRLERAEGVLNVIVRELAPLERFLAPAPGSESERARVHRLPGAADPVAADPQAGEEEDRAADIASDMRAVLPPMQSFAMGRRR
jgi:error-prone DNA polymerase